MAFADALIACLGDPDKAVQRRAADALSRVGDRSAIQAALERGLRAPDPQLRWGAAYALARTSGPARATLPVLVESLGHDDGDRRWAAAERLVALGETWPEGVADALGAAARTGGAVTRRMVLYCLRDLGSHGAVTEELVCRAFSDDDPGVRLAALATLPRCGSGERVVDAAVRLLEADPHVGVRRAAAAALARCPTDPAAARALARALESDDPGLVRAATRALRRP
jgi:HEAT repeat protein